MPRAAVLRVFRPRTIYLLRVVGDPDELVSGGYIYQYVPY